jgi:hypothetical protein
MKTLLVCLLFVPAIAMAQRADSAVVDTIFLQAQRLVAEGEADSGRAIVQAELTRAPTG